MTIKQDSLQRFLINRTHLRGEIVRLSQSYLTVMSQRPYPSAVAHLLGKTLAVSVLLTASIKFKGNLIIQLENQGPLEFLVAHCDDQFNIRGVAKWQADADDFKDALSQGTLAITITPENGERYQGIISLETNDLALAIEKYFQQSEQLATLIALGADEQDVVGILLQKLPNSSPSTHDDANWDDLENQLRQLTKQEMLLLDNELLISKLFQYEDVIVYEPEPVNFRCTCTEERSINAIRALTKDDIDELLETYKQISVSCEFCHHAYHFDAAMVNSLLNK